MKKLLSLFLISFQTLYASELPHKDSFPQFILGVMLLLIGAKIGAILAKAVNQPPVLGELCVGIFFASLPIFGVTGLVDIFAQDVFTLFAEFGALMLLFEVGLESHIKDILKVGLTATLVAIIGVVVPMGLGYAASSVLLSDRSFYVHLFVGSCLAATSVGITARVLKDLKKIHTSEAKIILGAAVIDDILGLIVLAVISGMITQHSSLEAPQDSLFTTTLWITFKAFGFLGCALLLGHFLFPKIFQAAARFNNDGLHFTVAFVLCLLFSYFSHVVGLAPIVGAFAAGLLIDGEGFSKFFTRETKSLDDSISPIAKFFIPIFFVHMGLRVDLTTWAEPSVLLMGLALSFVAIIGKQACSLVLLNQQTINPWVVGFGMIPRGEVGLIFAAMGTQLFLDGHPIIDPQLYSAVLIMVMLTTLVTPPLLKASLNK